MPEKRRLVGYADDVPKFVAGLTTHGFFYIFYSPFDFVEDCIAM